MSRKEAEITKIALNCFLTTKIAYANMVGDTAIASGCDPTKILSAIGADSRIGNKYLNYGYGFGGPCFPRDNKAFGNFTQSVNVDPIISRATDKSNDHHLVQQLIQKRNSGKTKFVFNTVTYKPESTLLVQSQQLRLATLLANEGFEVTIVERETVINELKEKYGNKFIYESVDRSENCIMD
jgi:UDP-glucose 6-dehydrogenase